MPSTLNKCESGAHSLEIWSHDLMDLVWKDYPRNIPDRAMIPGCIKINNFSCCIRYFTFIHVSCWYFTFIHVQTISMGCLLHPCRIWASLVRTTELFIGDIFKVWLIKKCSNNPHSTERMDLSWMVRLSVLCYFVHNLAHGNSCLRAQDFGIDCVYSGGGPLL